MVDLCPGGKIIISRCSPFETVQLWSKVFLNICGNKGDIARGILGHPVYYTSHVNLKANISVVFRDIEKCFG